MTSNKSEDREISGRLETARYLVGLLFGAGATGGAMSFVAREGASIIALVAFLSCLLVGSVIYFGTERAIRNERQRSHRNTLDDLNIQYKSCFEAVGSFFPLALRRIQASRDSEGHLEPSYALNAFANELRTQANATRAQVAGPDVIKTFREGVEFIADKWQESANNLSSFEEGAARGEEPISPAQ
jgi:uncharacterized membrane protein